MRRKLPHLAALLLLALPSHAEVPAADTRAIQGIIDAQIEAFARDDADTAFTFASDALQTMFGTPETFMRMVRNGYQPVYRPRSRVFTDPKATDTRIEQEMPVIGPDDTAWVAIYTMEKDPTGRWRIAGCRLEHRTAPSS